MLGLPLQDSLQQGWTYTCFAIVSPYSIPILKSCENNLSGLYLNAFKLWTVQISSNIIKYLEAILAKKNRSNRYAGCWQNIFQLQPLWVSIYASLNFLWGFRLQQPCLYQLPRTRWCQTLLAPHHSAGWPIILEMQFYQVCYCSVDCSNALTSCQNALGSGWVSTNKALHLAVWPFPITLASWPGGHEDSFWHQMQQDSARPYSIHNYT